MAKNQQLKQSDSFLRFVFILYAATMLWLLLCRTRDYDPSLSYRQMLSGNINLQPLHTIRNYLYVLRHSTNPAFTRDAVINLGGNVLLFIPAGILIPRLWRNMRNFFRFLLLCTGVILAVETVQLFTLLGSFDVDDLILNLFGMTVGFLLFTVAKALRTHHKE